MAGFKLAWRASSLWRSIRSALHRLTTFNSAKMPLLSLFGYSFSSLRPSGSNHIYPVSRMLTPHAPTNPRPSNAANQYHSKTPPKYVIVKSILKSSRDVRLRSLARLLSVAADNLDLVGVHGLVPIVHLEGDVLDQERPHLVAESVRIETSLQRAKAD